MNEMGRSTLWAVRGSKDGGGGGPGGRRETSGAKSNHGKKPSEKLALKIGPVLS